MFRSKYLPVNVKRCNSAVYTTTNCYPTDLLLQAEEALSHGKGLGTTVLLEDNNVTFVGSPEISWTVPDVYLACESLHVAENNNYTVCDKEGVPQLFISKAFKKHRLVVLAFTFETVLVTKANLLKRVASMIDHTYDHNFCINFFYTVAALEDNKNKYLSGIIVGRDTEDEAMIVNPITTLYADNNIIYDKQVIEDYRTLLECPTAVCECVEIVDDLFQRKGRINFTPVTKQHAKEMVELYDKMTAKKNNYIDLQNGTYDTLYYVSSNLRYLVNAQTFECVVVKNAYIKRLLQKYVNQGSTTLDLIFCWRMANVESKYEG